MPKKVKTKNKPLNKELLSQISHLETLLKYSLRNVNGRNAELDSIFTNQALKLEVRIKKLKEYQ